MNKDFKKRTKTIEVRNAAKSKLDSKTSWLSGTEIFSIKPGDKKVK